MLAARQGKLVCAKFLLTNIGSCEKKKSNLNGVRLTMSVASLPIKKGFRPDRRIKPTGVAFMTVLAVSAVCLDSNLLAAPASRIVKPSLGGIDPRPVIVSVSNTQGRLQARAVGFQAGPFQAEYSTNLSSGVWTKVGPLFTNNSFTVDLTNLAEVCIYRITGPFPSYAGASIGGLACGQCHSLANGGTQPWDIWYDYWVETPHARAFATLTNHNPANATNASCLPCHTVAFGYPGGYTPGNSALEGVQCESCHGPGGVRHRTGLDRRPAIEWSAMLCGGCHTTAPYPAYDEWKTSGHAPMQQDIAASFHDSTNGLANRFRCGSCHSGAMRAYLMVPWGGDMPDAVEAGREGVVCVACHDPHSNTAHGHQLRNPVFSTNNYSVTPATNWTSFSQHYQAEVNLCGQCHNARGARWTDTSEPPHASPQYNMLLGSIGELSSGLAPYQPAAHGVRITNQCVGCHMPTRPYQSEALPAITGHAFTVNSFDSCRGCHSLPELLVQFTTAAVSNQIQEVKASLDRWATNRAPEALRTKYGVRAWEFTRPGALSNPTGVTNAGPSSVEQPLIPVNIRKARFNLYLVLQDGSYGVHNGPYSITLIETARNWVQAELAR